MDVIAGTAGHIDHGKTALIKALTGVDADRLPEEKERGITIDLGFAEMEIADIRFGFVDVPGHERFVKNMLAGASGIDLVLLIVAADEGIMPQTREHFDICRLLGIHSGVIVLTKTDLVDDEMLELVRDEVAELVAGSFLAASPVVAVSSKNGEGISDLRAALIESARKLPERERSLITRLPIDRSFSVKGFGTVITGTLASGEIAEADELVVLPQGKTVRVRGLQTYGHAVKAVQAGQRTAVNLGGIDRDEVGRGMILTEKGTLRPTQMIDARLEVLDDAKRPLKSRQRVRVHIGTAEVLARLFVINETNEIALGESDFAQLRLELPVAAVLGERFVLRSYSPQVTIAGGTVLDPMPVKHKRSDIPDSRTFLGALAGAAGDEVERTRLFVERSGEHGISFSGLQASTGLRKDLLADTLAQNIDTREMIKTGNLYLSVTAFRDLRTQTIAKIKRHHQFDPLSQGIPKETLREKTFPYVALEVFKSVIADLEHDKKIRIEQDIVRSVEHKTKLSGEEATVLDRLRVIYAGMNLDVPKLDDGLTEAARMTRLNSEARRKVFQLLVDSREVVKINVDLYVSRTALDDVVEKLRRHAAATGDRSIEVPKFKEIAGVSRKYAIPLLEYFDREKITRRIGDKRLIL